MAAPEGTKAKPLDMKLELVMIGVTDIERVMRDQVVGRRLEGHGKEDLWHDPARAPGGVFEIVAEGLSLD